MNSLCKLRTYTELGNKFKNGSFFGALKMIKEDTIDAIARPNGFFLNEDFLGASHPVSEEHFLTFQLLDDENTFNRVTSLRIFNLQIWLLLFSILEFLFIFILIFKSLPRFKRKTEHILRFLVESKFYFSKKFNRLSFLLFFYMVYVLFYKNMIINNIKSTKVLVNTSILVDTKDDFLQTKLLPCFWFTELEYYLITTSPPNSYLQKLLMVAKKNGKVLSKISNCILIS